MSDPWSDIPDPRPGQRTIRRADPHHPLDFWRGREGDGQYLLLLENVTGDLPRSPEIAGVDFELENQRKDSSTLVLKLVDAEQIALFGALCSDLLEATSHLPDHANNEGAGVVIGRMRRGQELLQRRRNKLLSRQEIIGLVGELLFLRDVMLVDVSAEEAARSWRGGHGDEQDFAVGEIIVETKTQLSSADQAIKISSEAQLDTTSGSIVIRHQTLASSDVGQPDARSLNEIVEEVRALLSRHSHVARDIFEAGLIAWGYETRKEYGAEA